MFVEGCVHKLPGRLSHCLCYACALAFEKNIGRWSVLLPRRSLSERICAQSVQVPVHGVNEYSFARVIAVPVPQNCKENVEIGLVPRGQISERLCQQIVEVGSTSGRAVLCVRV